MNDCFQTENQSVYEHGISVSSHMFELIKMLKTNKIKENWKIPDWFLKYRLQILNNLFSDEIINEYCIFHDCGKPYCIIYDLDNKKHFPNHSEVSYQTWLKISDDYKVANLIKMDMTIHTIKDVDIDGFVKNPEAITLLISGLAEVHSNAKMFGGIESTSFKIKWKQIDKRGNKICQKLFNMENKME